MKALSFILIVYIMFLVVQPCQDYVAMSDDCIGNETQTAHFGNGSGDESEGDDCSPFCVCSCCSHSVAYHKLFSGVSSEVKVVPIIPSKANYTNRYSKAHQNSIWQPPKA